MCGESIPQEAWRVTRNPWLRLHLFQQNAYICLILLLGVPFQDFDPFPPIWNVFYRAHPCTLWNISLRSNTPLPTVFPHGKYNLKVAYSSTDRLTSAFIFFNLVKRYWMIKELCITLKEKIIWTFAARIRQRLFRTTAVGVDTTAGEDK